MTTMDIRDSQATTQKKQQSKSSTSFVGDIKTEVQKISWTSKEELIAYTKIVVAATFILGMGIYFTDILIQTCLSALNTIVRLIVG